MPRLLKNIHFQAELPISFRKKKKKPQADKLAVSLAPLFPLAIAEDTVRDSETAFNLDLETDCSGPGSHLLLTKSSLHS